MYAKELVSPCGLYCGVCGIRKATAENDEALRTKLAGAYGVAPADIHCRGCCSDEVFGYCTVCAIKTCATQKGFEGCYQCAAFPCEIIERFPVAEARQTILRAVPRWREVGTQAWIEEEEDRVRCGSCGTPAFRGARRCRACQAALI